MASRFVASLERWLHAHLLRRTPLEWTLRSGLRVRVEGLAEWIVYNEIFVDQEYDAAIEAAFEHVGTGAPVNVVDLGANVGFFSLRLADLARRRPAALREVSVLLVEGSPQCHAILQRRLALNPQLGGSLRAKHGLVGPRNGTGTIYQHAFHAANSVNNPVMREQGSGVNVQYVDIEGLTSNMARIDLLKCDIEGSERDFLEAYPDWLRKLQAAVFELHPTICDVPRCREILAHAGLVRQAVLRTADDQSVEYFVRA